MPAVQNAVDVHLHLSRWWREIRVTGYRSDIDYTLKGLLHEMDVAGIERGVLIQTNDAPSPPEGLVEARELVAQSEGRLHLVSTVDPTQGEAAVTHMIALWNDVPELSGIKLFPGYHPFYPHDRRLDPVYEYAKRRKIPILIHTGDTMDNGGLIKYSRPIEIDEVAVRFRDVPFVLCHFGNPWINEAAELVYKNPNVWADTSGLLAHPSYPFYKEMVEVCRRRVLDAILQIGSTEKVLYGSDWPLLDLQVALTLVTALPLPEKDRAAVLGENARRLYGMPAAGRARPGPS